MKRGEMLSRVASALFWSSRYSERAEHTARVLRETFRYGQELAGLSAPAAMAIFEEAALLHDLKAYSSPEELLSQLVYDPYLPTSVLSCIAMSRENARSIRESVSSEMWQTINVLYHRLTNSNRTTANAAEIQSTLWELNEVFHQLHGLRDHTMSRGEAYQFIRLGRYIERADLTLRLLDHMFHHPALVLAEDEGLVIHTIHLSSTLRMCTSLEAFSRDYTHLTPESIAEFLVLSPESPRAVLFAFDEIEAALHSLSRSPREVFTTEAEQLVGRIVGELRFSSADELIEVGYHETSERLLGKLNHLTALIALTYFG
ncbi:MAG: alpha-E domain-containing protein [Fimbriimonadaceae bacterium]|nr:alpha-E domain-containing protein [Fimbriimonadaceae bacterium]